MNNSKSNQCKFKSMGVNRYKKYCFKWLNLPVLVFILNAWFVTPPVSFAGNTGDSELAVEYKQDRESVDASAKKKDIAEFEKQAGLIGHKWHGKNAGYYARLMLQTSELISSGQFHTARKIAVARKYALMGLEYADAVPLKTELDLVGQVVTDTVLPDAPKGQDFADQRKQDAIARLHVWKRLQSTIDPAWDQNDLPQKSILLPDYGKLSPKSEEAKKLREKYEIANEKNNKKAAIYVEQSDAREWLKDFAPRAEQYIVQMYARPPFDSKELDQLLAIYLNNETRIRILDEVSKMIEATKISASEKPQKEPAQGKQIVPGRRKQAIPKVQETPHQ